MDNYPSITVLLPVYLKSKSFAQIRLLRDALTSVLEQKYPGDLEVIIIDDGSPFPIQGFAEELGPGLALVQWLRLDYNQGIVGALNAGIAASCGDLIGRIDADDSWLEGKLAAQVAQFREDPDLSISATGMVRVDTSGREIDRHIRPGDWEGILRFFVEVGCPFPHGSVLADRRVYRALGGYPHSGAVRHCEDYALWSTWLRFFKPTMVEEAYYSYRVSGGSVSAEFMEQQASASRKISRGFQRLELAPVLPQMLPALAEALDCSLFEAGLLAYRIWHFRAAVSLPENAIAPLAAILPDRVITQVATAPHWSEAVPRSSRQGFKSTMDIAIRANSLGETA